MLLIIDVGLMPRFVNWYSVLYVGLHLGLLVLAGQSYKNRRRRYLDLRASLVFGVQPGQLDELNYAHGAVTSARLLLILLLCWEFGGSALLYAAGHSAHLW